MNSGRLPIAAVSLAVARFRLDCAALDCAEGLRAADRYRKRTGCDACEP